MKPSTIRKNYSPAPLSDLLSLISLQSDGDALRELLSNRKPFMHEGRRCGLPLFLREISSTASSQAAQSQDLVDCAYDMTLDKFTQLPMPAESLSTVHAGQTEILKSRVIDCRNYYRAILMQLDRWRNADPLAGKIDEELAVSSIMQRMVVKHFYLSLKECLRAKMPFTKRYMWKTHGGTLSLRRPVEVPGGEFRKWLEENIIDPDPKRPGEGKSIQLQVDKHFSRGSFVPWDEQAASQVAAGKDQSNTTTQDGDSAKSSLLASTVAHEKVGRIEAMRPAIRELGKEKLFSLVNRIFADIEDGINEDTRIANDFGLTKATYSRFAGSDWNKHIDEEEITVPDLWLNLAEVLSTNSEFTEVALTAGILPKLKKIMMTRRVSNAQ